MAASWKKGLRLVSADERSSECVGYDPVILAKSGWCWIRDTPREGRGEDGLASGRDGLASCRQWVR